MNLLLLSESTVYVKLILCVTEYVKLIFSYFCVSSRVPLWNKSNRKTICVQDKKVWDIRDCFLRVEYVTPKLSRNFSRDTTCRSFVYRICFAATIALCDAYDSLRQRSESRAQFLWCPLRRQWDTESSNYDCFRDTAGSGRRLSTLT